MFQKRNPLLKRGLCLRASWKLASLWLFVCAQVKTGKEDVVLLEDPPPLRIHVENKLETCGTGGYVVYQLNPNNHTRIFFLNKCNILFYNHKLGQKIHKTNEITKMGY